MTMPAVNLHEVADELEHLARLARQRAEDAARQDSLRKSRRDRMRARRAELRLIGEAMHERLLHGWTQAAVIAATVQETGLPPDYLGQLIARRTMAQARRARMRRNRRILALHAQGLKNIEIARQLDIHPKTVQRTVDAAYALARQNRHPAAE